MRCSDCRKKHIETTKPWERLRQRFFHMFHEELVDYNQEKYTQGFGDGFREGCRQMEENMKKTAKVLHNIDL